MTRALCGQADHEAQLAELTEVMNDAYKHSRSMVSRGPATWVEF